MTTVKTLVIYDKAGTIIACYNANSVDMPVGVPYIVVEIPAGASIKRVDPSTGQPIYVLDSDTISELDKMNSKMDYIAMMNSIDISDIMDPLEGTIDNITIIDGSQENHSQYYKKLYNYYLSGLWGLSAIRNAVGRWITQSEYTQLVKAKDEQNVYINQPDTKNEIPAISAKG